MMTIKQQDDWFSHPRFATELAARVVDTSGSEPRIHGFEVHRDLGRHFAFSDVLLLSLTGAEPDERSCRVFSRALIALVPNSVASAPVHAGVLAAMFSRDFSNSLAAAAIVITERTRDALRQRLALLEWLRHDAAPEPTKRELPAPAPVTAEPAVSPEFLSLVASDSALAQHSWFRNLDLVSAALGVLFECGLTEDWQLQSALFTAWSPSVMAEAGAALAQPLEAYPINLPKFQYVDEE